MTLIISASFLVFLILHILVLIACRRSSVYTPKREYEKSITVIKPVKGSIAPFREAVESFFKQDYFDYEIIFVIDDKGNAALIDNLAKDFPQVRARIICDKKIRVANPKVSKIISAYEMARGEIVVISDIDVVAPTSYLSSINAQFQDRNLDDVGIITHPIRFKPNDNPWSKILSIYMNTLIHGGLRMVNRFFKGSFPIGKSIAFKRMQFDHITTFEELGNYLGEDYMMGKMFQNAGLRTHISSIPIQSIMQEASFQQILARMTRWSKMRLRSNKKAFVGEIFLNPLVLYSAALMGSLLADVDPLLLTAIFTIGYAFKLAVGIRVRSDVGCSRHLHPLLTIASDFVHSMAWIAAVVIPWVTWKTGRIYIGRDTIIRQSSPSLQTIKPLLLLLTTALSAPIFYTLRWLKSVHLRPSIICFLEQRGLYDPQKDSLIIKTLNGSLTNLTFCATVNGKRMVVKHFWRFGAFILVIDRLLGPKVRRATMGSREERFWNELMGNQKLRGLGWSVPQIFAYDPCRLLICMEHISGTPLDKIGDRRVLIEEYEKFGEKLSSLHNQNTYLVDNYASHRILRDGTDEFCQLDLENITTDGSREWDLSLFLFYLRYLYTQDLRERLLRAFIKGYRTTSVELQQRLEPYFLALTPYGWLAKLATSYR